MPSTANNTVRLAVLGSPIAHSKSPQLHLAAYRALGLDWSYQRAEVTEQQLAGFVGGLDAHWRGLSLTMPLKHAVLNLLTTMDDTARLTGAANTVYFDRSGQLEMHGFNTDAVGIVRALAANGVGALRSVWILGSGATAASTLVAVAALGARACTVFARSTRRAAALAPIAARLGIALDVQTFGAPEAPSADPQPPDLVVSTLPGGAHPPPTVSESVMAASALLDVAYDPWPSHLAGQWSQAGGRVVSGLDMLVQQALVQVRVFVHGDSEHPLADEGRVLAAMRAAAAAPNSDVPES